MSFYRPAPDGKSVRLPFAPRPVLRPADRLVSEALGLGRSVRFHPYISLIFESFLNNLWYLDTETNELLVLLEEKLKRHTV